MTENPEENGVSGALERRKKEAKIGFAGAQMTRRKGEKSNRKLQAPSVRSHVGNEAVEESRVSRSRGGGAQLRLRPAPRRLAGHSGSCARRFDPSQIRYSVGEGGGGGGE